LVDDLGVELVIDDGSTRPRVSQIEVARPPAVEDHPFFSRLETQYSGDHQKLLAQVKTDRALLDKVMAIWDQQRAAGKGKLAGHKQVSELAGQDGFLDGHVYVLPEKPGVEYELT